MKITWYGHSCFMLESAEGSAVFDPYSDGSVPGWQLPQLTADAVLCSHGHADHGGAEKVTLSGREPAFAVESVASFHDDAGGAQRGSNTIHIVAAEGLRVAHLGDLGHALDERQLGQLRGVDVLLIPVGGCYTIDAKQADAVARAVDARITVPMHYRGEGFGYDVIGPLEDFTALRDDVKYVGSPSFDPADWPEKVTLVLKAPV